MDETEEKLDQKMRMEVVWKLESWREERTGDGKTDRLRQKAQQDDEDVQTSIYADNTQSRAAAKTIGELEQKQCWTDENMHRDEIIEVEGE